MSIIEKSNSCPHSPVILKNEPNSESENDPSEDEMIPPENDENQSKQLNLVASPASSKVMTKSSKDVKMTPSRSLYDQGKTTLGHSRNPSGFESMREQQRISEINQINLIHKMSNKNQESVNSESDEDE
jgi:hypothetical protein